MKRIMVNLDDTAGDLLEKKAAADKRSTSSYVALLVEADLRAAGLLAAAEPEPALQAFFAKVSAAAAASPRIVPRLEATLRRQLRQPKSAA